MSSSLEKLFIQISLIDKQTKPARLRKLQRDEGSYDLLCVYARKHFPGRPLDSDCLAEAQFLEWDFWERMKKLLGG